MDRYFYRRGERVPVTELEGVLAVQMEETARGTPESAPLASEASFAAPIPEEERAALSSAGWVFVQPARGWAESALAEGGRPAGVREAGQVFQQQDGHVLIGKRSLIVQLSPELTEVAARRELRKRNLTIVRALAFAPNQFQVEVPADQDLLSVANELQESDVAVAAEPEFIEHIGQRFTPNDPAYTQQWQLNNTGGNGGVAGADIRAEQAWDFSRGRGVRVAVIDNGFDVAHGDLAAAIVAESGFFDATSTFQQTLTNYPDQNHGTFCAGMVAARHNNGRDGCGSAPECELMLVAARGDQVGTQATLARAVAYAANPQLEVASLSPATGADVIVSSLGPNGANWALTTVLENAIFYVTRQGRRGRGTRSSGQAATATMLTSPSTRWSPTRT